MDNRNPSNKEYNQKSVKTNGVDASIGKSLSSASDMPQSSGRLNAANISEMSCIFLKDRNLRIAEVVNVATETKRTAAQVALNKAI